jgi:predicted esterase
VSASAGASAPRAPEDAGPRATHVEVPRTARLWTVGDPAARDVWIALHGYGQLAEYFVRHFVPHAGTASGRLVVAPEALSRFYLGSSEGGGGGQARVGATWMTREDRAAEIRDYVRYLDLALDAVTAGREAGSWRLHVLGFSQGATTAVRWLHHRHAQGRAPAATLALWGGALPHDLDLAVDGAVLRATPLVLVVGDADPYVTAEREAEHRRRLDEARIAYRHERYAGGHRLEAEPLGALLASA